MCHFSTFALTQGELFSRIHPSLFLHLEQPLPNLFGISPNMEMFILSPASAESCVDLGLP